MKDPFQMFDKLRKEKRGKLDTTENTKGLDELINGFTTFRDKYGTDITDYRYDKALNIVKQRDYTKEDVELYCTCLRDVLEERKETELEEQVLTMKMCTEYLAAATNNILQEKDEILWDLSKLPPTGHLGMMQDKGSIIIKGNSFMGLGFRKKGGELTLYGFAGLEVGWQMEDGRIYIEGKPGEISNEIKGGEIYTNGKKTWPK